MGGGGGGDHRSGQSFVTASLEELPRDRGYDSPEPPPAQYPIDLVEDGDAENFEEMERLPCPHCGRKFLGEDRLDKHATACSKLKARKIFDAAKARTKGTELEQYANRKPKATDDKKGKDPQGEKTPLKPQKSSWRVKHDNFIKMVRSNRTTDPAKKAEPVTYEPDPDLVPCDHCGRRFNEAAAERHIPICASSKHRSKLKLGGFSNPQEIVAGAPDESLRKRMSFKPPAPKTKSPAKRK
ncbi:Zinc finger C2HC domain-containing protein 1C [Dinochytrium kinnereticum]|nr:Zinc finger C2HC domain-containing protein 1C [Dinochytrium kinnereticum]